MKNLVFILVILFSTNSNAAFNSGNDILSLCEAKEGDKFYFQKNAECRGYVAGFYDHFTGTVKDGVICLFELDQNNQKILLWSKSKKYLLYMQTKLPQN